MQDLNSHTSDRKISDSIQLSDLTKFGKLMTFVVGPSLAIAAFYLLTVLGGTLLGFVMFIVGINSESISNMVTFPIALCALALTYFTVSPVSRRVDAWFTKRGLPIVGSKVQNDDSRQM